VPDLSIGKKSEQFFDGMGTLAATLPYGMPGPEPKLHLDKLLMIQNGPAD